LVDLNITNENFSFRGEALVSISDISVLEIVTRAYGRPNGYQKGEHGREGNGVTDGD